MSLIDGLVFGCILLVTFLAVWWGQKKRAPGDFLDQMVMGRQLSLPLFVFTLVATWYGGIFGVAEIAYSKGLFNFLTQGIFWYLSYLCFAFFILPKIKPTKYLTLPHLVAGEIGPYASKIVALLNIINLIPIAYVISLGLFIDTFFQIGFLNSSILGLLIVLSYSSWGGFRSVVYSDLIQFFVMVSSVIFILIFCIYKFGLSPLNHLPSSYFNPLENNSWGEIFMWGLIAFGTLIDPNFYQRCYAANNPKTAKKGIVIATLIWMVFDISLTLGAMYAAALSPELDSKTAYLNFSLDILPVGLKGFFLAGVLATILSTLDSYLFLAGATLNHDVMKAKLKPFISIFIIATLSLILSAQFKANIKQVWSFFGGLSTSALLIPMLSFYFKQQMPERTFLIMSLMGAISFMMAYNFYDPIYAIYIGMAGSFIFNILAVPQSSN